RFLVAQPRIVGMGYLDHRRLFEQFHERYGVFLLDLPFRSIDVGQREMRIDERTAKPGKMFRAREDVSPRQLFDERGCETRHFSRIGSETSLRNDGLRKSKVHDG